MGGNRWHGERAQKFVNIFDSDILRAVAQPVCVFDEPVHLIIIIMVIFGHLRQYIEKPDGARRRDLRGRGRGV